MTVDETPAFVEARRLAALGRSPELVLRTLEVEFGLTRLEAFAVLAAVRRERRAELDA